MNHITILGDSIKKSRFNKDLANVVNKDVEDRLRKEERDYKLMKKNVPNYAFTLPVDIPESSTLINNNKDSYMDLYPANSGNMMNQDEWIKYWNRLAVIRFMASAADYYAAGKSGDSKLINNLRESFRDQIITSDRLIYKGDVTDELVRYYNSAVVKSSKKIVFMPDYSRKPFEEEMLDRATYELGSFNFLQRLFKTNDSADEIQKVLNKLSGKDKYHICVKSSSHDVRSNFSNYGVSLYYSKDDKFIIDARHTEPAEGCSYGVYRSPKVKK